MSSNRREREREGAGVREWERESERERESKRERKGETDRDRETGRNENSSYFTRVIDKQFYMLFFFHPGLEEDQALFRVCTFC